MAMRKWRVCRPSLAPVPRCSCLSWTGFIWQPAPVTTRKRPSGSSGQHREVLSSLSMAIREVADTGHQSEYPDVETVYYVSMAAAVPGPLCGVCGQDGP